MKLFRKSLLLLTVLLFALSVFGCNKAEETALPEPELRSGESIPELRPSEEIPPLVEGELYTLTVMSPANGTVTSTPAGINCGAICSFDFAKDSPVTLTASPALGYVFKEWTGDCTGRSLTCSVTLAGNIAVTAAFEASPEGLVPTWSRRLGLDRFGLGRVDLERESRRWKTQMYGGADEDEANGVAVSSDGTIYVAGKKGETALLLAYDKNGTKKWERQLLFGEARGVVLDGDENIYLYGNTLSNVSITAEIADGGTPSVISGLSNKGRIDIFFAKYNSNGDRKWIIQNGSIKDDIVSGAVMRRDFVFLVGTTSVDVNRWGEDSPSSTDNKKTFILQYQPSSSGAVLYSKKTVGVPSGYDFTNMIAMAVTKGSDNYIYLAGYATCIPPSCYKINSFIIKVWNLTGTPEPIVTFFSDIDKPIKAYSIAVDSENNVYVAGDHELSTENIQSFLYQFKQTDDGIELLEGSSFGWDKTDHGKGLILDRDNNIYVFGDMNCDSPFSGATGQCNAFVVKYDSSGLLQSWWKELVTQDGKGDFATGAAMSPDWQYVYVVGYTYGKFDDIENKGNSDIFILKLNAETGVKQ